MALATFGNLVTRAGEVPNDVPADPAAPGQPEVADGL